MIVILIVWVVGLPLSTMKMWIWVEMKWEIKSWNRRLGCLTFQTFLYTSHNNQKFHLPPPPHSWNWNPWGLQEIICMTLKIMNKIIDIFMFNVIRVQISLMIWVEDKKNFVFLVLDKFEELSRCWHVCAEFIFKFKNG